MDIRRVKASDAAAMCEIYNHYVINTTITFEQEPLKTEEMSARISQNIDQFDWIVGEIDGNLAGYAYYGRYRERAAYSQTVESTVYLDHRLFGRGYGTELYRALIKSAFERGFQQMIGIIALPNPASAKLHAKMGFIEAGVLKKVGFKFGRYIDTALWQREM